MHQKAIKNVLSPTEEGDAATKGYIDSKSAGESDLDMRGHLVKNVRWPEEDHDSMNLTYVYHMFILQQIQNFHLKGALCRATLGWANI